MTFEQAKELSETIHYVVILAVAAAVIFYKPTLRRVVYRSYITFGAWVILVYLMNGCPLTHLENYISTQVYGREFYPNYEFSDSDVFAVLHNNTDLIFPSLLILILLQWQSKEKARPHHLRNRRGPYSR